MQSEDGTLHLLPALPDAWLAEGRIAGLRAVGGFDLVSMQWKEGKLLKAVIRSNAGGNLRLRVPNEMHLNNGTLKKAAGENKNPFYQTEVTAAPVVSEKATITAPALKETFVYDIPTQRGQLLTLSAVN